VTTEWDFDPSLFRSLFVNDVNPARENDCAVHRISEKAIANTAINLCDTIFDQNTLFAFFSIYVTTPPGCMHVTEGARLLSRCRASFVKPRKECQECKETEGLSLSAPHSQSSDAMPRHVKFFPKQTLIALGFLGPFYLTSFILPPKFGSRMP
jgi:hypothetical protein